MTTTITINAAQLTQDTDWYLVNNNPSGGLSSFIQHLSVGIITGVWDPVAQTFTGYGAPAILDVQADATYHPSFWTMRQTLMNSINQQVAPSTTTTLSLVQGFDLAQGAVYASQ